mgnify:CR=1 FL=1
MKKLSHSFAKVSHSYKKGVALVGMRHLKPKSVIRPFSVFFITACSLFFICKSA